MDEEWQVLCYGISMVWCQRTNPMGGANLHQPSQSRRQGCKVCEVSHLKQQHEQLFLKLEKLQTHHCAFSMKKIYTDFFFNNNFIFLAISTKNCEMHKKKTNTIQQYHLRCNTLTKKRKKKEEK